MIKIICVGKIKEKFFRDAIEEYQKRLTKYTKINIIEVEDININNEELIKQKEKELILKHIEKKDYVITLEIEGKQLSSTELSKKIEEIEQINSNITFIIGGSYGLDDEIKNLSNYKLSFSKLTFPHQLFRVILLEQIYRAYKIKNNESYHK
ncbi:MAG: 23S rRNA (pseudouridine(1915)-N(3))-methyltransferase RlmH [Bacilli bacterium]